jgi:hypothetical protein
MMTFRILSLQRIFEQNQLRLSHLNIGCTSESNRLSPARMDAICGIVVEPVSGNMQRASLQRFRLGELHWSVRGHHQKPRFEHSFTV